MSTVWATMSKQRSPLSKGRNFNAKLVRHCCRFWQQNRTLLRHCCWCGPGLSLWQGNWNWSGSGPQTNSKWSSTLLQLCFPSLSDLWFWKYRRRRHHHFHMFKNPIWKDCCPVTSHSESGLVFRHETPFGAGKYVNGFVASVRIAIFTIRTSPTPVPRNAIRRTGLRLLPSISHRSPLEGIVP